MLHALPDARQFAQVPLAPQVVSAVLPTPPTQVPDRPQQKLLLQVPFPPLPHLLMQVYVLPPPVSQVGFEPSEVQSALPQQFDDELPTTALPQQMLPLLVASLSSPEPPWVHETHLFELHTSPACGQSFAVVHEQTLLEQVWPLAHCVPQALQFLASLVVSMHTAQVALVIGHCAALVQSETQPKFWVQRSGVPPLQAETHWPP